MSDTGLSIPWMPDFLGPSPMFDALRTAGAPLQRLHDWPTLDFLNQCMAQCHPPIHNCNRKAVRFVAQDRRQESFESKYEPRIYERGEVQTREANWHDLFNALVWMTFPQTKALLNARQYQEFLSVECERRPNRTPVQDALTIFDEGGAIVVSRNPVLLDLIRRFEWKALFSSHRAAVERDMRFFLFGHALYEKALAPYKGMTAKCALFTFDDTFFELEILQQLQRADQLTAGWLDRIGLQLRTSLLTPLPILGVPGWTPDNSDSQYYDDRNYFRAGYERRPRPADA